MMALLGHLEGHHGNDGPLSEMQEGREIQIMECDLSILSE